MPDHAPADVREEFQTAVKNMNFAVHLHTAAGEEYDDRHQTALRNAWGTLRALLSPPAEAQEVERLRAATIGECALVVDDLAEAWEYLPRDSEVARECAAAIRALTTTPQDDRNDR